MEEAGIEGAMPDGFEVTYMVQWEYWKKRTGPQKLEEGIPKK